MTILSSQIVNLIEQRLGINAETIRHADLSVDAIHDIEKLNHLPLTHPHWEHIINALTIGETYFMRDTRQFDTLRHEILPPLIKQRREASDYRLKLWSAACATGEEAYSLAILLHDLLPDYERWDIDLLGTDINQQALQQAQKAIYRDWSFRETDNFFKARYFNSHEQGYELKAQYKNAVRWQQHNLLNLPLIMDVDIIFCRNVLMYFSDAQANLVEKNLTMALSDLGWLFLGSAEHLKVMQAFSMPYREVPIYHHQSQSRSPIKFSPITTEARNEDLYTQAILATQQEKHDVALDLLRQLIATQPEHVDGHVMMAFILANMGDYPQALIHIQQALNINSLSADAHYVRALVFYEQADYIAAEKALGATLYSQREHILALFLLGTLHEQFNNTDDAVRVWRNLERTLMARDDNAYISDFSDIRVGAMKQLIATRVVE